MLFDDADLSISGAVAGAVAMDEPSDSFLRPLEAA
jgi:hypothetical protein